MTARQVAFEDEVLVRATYVSPQGVIRVKRQDSKILTNVNNWLVPALVVRTERIVRLMKY